MPKTVNPSNFVVNLPKEQRDWVQSLHTTLNGSIDLGVPIGQTPASFGINAKVFNTFQKGNGSGVLIRIAAHGSSGSGAPYTWPAAGGLVINHGLLRQPVGFHVVDTDKDVRCFRTAAPDKNQITIAPTDITASCTLYIF